MALPVTDTFTGVVANLSDPPYHNMRSGVSSMALDGSGNCKNGNLSLDSLYRRNDETFTDSQSVSVTLSANLSAGAAYVYLLLNVVNDYANFDGYWFWTDGAGDTVLNRTATGSATSVDSDGTFTCGNGDVLTLQNSGGTISLLKNGSPTNISYADGTPLTGGTPGFGAWNSSDIVRITSATFDNLAGGGGPTGPPPGTLLMMGAGT